MPTTVPTIAACAWCGRPFKPNAIGRPRRYCSEACRQDNGHYLEALPGWTARLTELEASAAMYERVPAFIRNEIDALRRSIAGRPSTRGQG